MRYNISSVLIGLLLTGCSAGVCRGNEGPTLETACAAWNGGRYERLPKMCGLDPSVGSTTTTWTDGDGTCTCNVTREFPTGFYDVSGCSFRGP